MALGSASWGGACVAHRLPLIPGTTDALHTHHLRSGISLSVQLSVHLEVSSAMSGAGNLGQWRPYVEAPSLLGHPCLSPGWLRKRWRGQENQLASSPLPDIPKPYSS